LYYDGANWIAMSRTTGYLLFDVWGSSSDVFAVGDYGTILHYRLVVAEFTASPRSGLAPLTVTFTNESAGDYTDSQWTFGDGETSTEADPTHTFTAVGGYTVTLTVSGPEGSDTETKPRYILAALDRLYLPLVFRDR
jgi:PKD repeat protein